MCCPSFEEAGSKLVSSQRNTTIHIIYLVGKAMSRMFYLFSILRRRSISMFCNSFTLPSTLQPSSSIKPSLMPRVTFFLSSRQNYSATWNESIDFRFWRGRYGGKGRMSPPPPTPDPGLQKECAYYVSTSQTSMRYRWRQVWSPPSSLVLTYSYLSLDRSTMALQKPEPEFRSPEPYYATFSTQSLIGAQ